MAVALIILVTLGIIVILGRSMTRWETTCAAASCGLHTIFAWVQVWLHTRYYHGVGDMFGYLASGGTIARLMSIDFSRFAWETVKLFLHMNASGIPGETAMNSTQSMDAATAFILFSVGNSMLAACVFVGALATVGQLGLYLVIRTDVPPAARRGAAVAMMLVPSVLFWSSAVTKEGLTLSFFALLACGALMISRGRWVVGGPGAALGAIGVAMLKPYVLFPFVLAVVAWAYVSRVHRTGEKFRLSYIGIALAIGLLGLAAMGTLFPEFSLGHFAKAAAYQQELGAEVGGGSYIDVGDADARSFWQQLPYVPLALVDSLFRPLIVEARNAPMLGAAIETTSLAIASAYLLARVRLRKAAGAVLSSPLLAFCFVFTLSFAIAVGLATTNLGTLSRYRMPMMPCYVLLLVLLRAETRRVDSATWRPRGSQPRGRSTVAVGPHHRTPRAR